MSWLSSPHSILLYDMSTGFVFYLWSSKITTNERCPYICNALSHWWRYLLQLWIENGYMWEDVICSCFCSIVNINEPRGYRPVKLRDVRTSKLHAIFCNYNIIPCPFTDREWRKIISGIFFWSAKKWTEETLLALCEGDPLVTVDFPHKGLLINPLRAGTELTRFN